MSVEIPYHIRYSSLHEKVIKHMVHSPCGELKKNNSCMQDDKCKNNSPCSFSTKTMQGKDFHPISE